MAMDIDYIEKGYCSFKLGDSLRKQTKDIPAGYGVYIFHKNVENGDILYIGKGGTILQRGCYRTQNLKSRLNNKQDRMRRENFLIKKMNEDDDIRQIFIEWYIVDQQKYLPSYIEAQLLQDYYSQNSCLPMWNNAF